jgi:hypothetical protein
MSETGGYTSIGVWLSYNYLPVVLKTQLEMTIRARSVLTVTAIEFGSGRLREELNEFVDSRAAAGGWL